MGLNKFSKRISLRSNRQHYELNCVVPDDEHRRKSSNEHTLDVIRKVKNSYIFKVNEKLVRLHFLKTDKLLMSIL